LAKNGLPAAMPNPSVGAVIVYDGKIIGEGYTSAYGGAHAEVNAIAFAKAHYPDLLADATIYVSLEPCSHHGKTPPCADLIIDSGIKNVVIGMVDPFAKVAGAGIKKLMMAGCTVTMGILEEACRESNQRFFTFHEKKRPYIILKWAETADGYIAPKKRNTQEPVWITNTISRQLVHKWRSEEQAILVGGQTVLADNPSLTTRSWEGKSPLRVVLETHGNLPKTLSVFDKNAPTLFLTTAHPQHICDRLFKEGIQSVIIEGGAKTLQSFIDANLWDTARVFIGKTTFGAGITAPTLSENAIEVSKKHIEDDLLISYKNKTS
jgi:diaminohydroxyphosphoribosylaminopyrimidine deaminase/5-amino-6-(5-phosphoribosylamino)uracil reductase